MYEKTKLSQIYNLKKLNYYFLGIIKCHLSFPKEKCHL